MRKAIAMLIVLAMGVSLWADGSPDRPSRTNAEIRLPDHRDPGTRTETYELFMADSYGDGWNGASLDLYVNGVLIAAGLTVDAADNDGEWNNYFFDVEIGNNVATVWTEGSYDSECAYGFYDAEGNLVHDAAGEATSFGVYDYEGYCNAGNDEWLGDWSAHSAGYLIFTQVEVEAPGTASYLSIITGANDGDEQIQMGFYTDDGTRDVQDLVAHTDIASIFTGAGSVQQVVLTESVAIDAGSYWLAIVGSNPFSIGYVASGQEVQYSAHVFGEPLPETIETPASYDGQSFNQWLSVAGECAGDGDCETNEYAVTCDGGSWQSEVTWNIADADGNVLLDGACPVVVDDGVTACLDDGTYTVNMYDAYGDGWNGNFLTLWTYDGTTYTESFSFTLEGGSEGSETFIVGESDDVLGCTDPEALNYNPDATLDDGSCVYAGDECSTALSFADAGGTTDGASSVEGATTVAYDVDWYHFEIDQGWENLRISLAGSDFDTQMEVWDECDDASYVAYNDDANGELQSEVILTDVTAGDGYVKIFGFGSGFGNYVLTIEAYMDPTNPTNLSALGGLNQVYLEWTPAQPSAMARASAFNGTVEEHIELRYAKKEAAPDYLYEGRSLESVMEEHADNVGQTRDTEVYITLFDSYGDGHYGGDCDGCAYVVDSEGNILETLEGGWTGESNTYGPFTFADGQYNVAWDETASWLSEQSMEVTSAADGTVLGFGAAPVACFALGEGYACGAPDLAMTELVVDSWSGMAMATISNIGSLDAGGFYTMCYNGMPDTTDLYPGYLSYGYTAALAAGETAVVPLLYGGSIPSDLGGYDDETYTIYGFADGWGDFVVEAGGNYNNLAMTEYVNSNPLGNSSWNVWRSDAGADYAVIQNVTFPGWTPGANILYTDADVTADVEYCYMVTQVDGDTESEASDASCATPSAPPDVPEPTDLVGSSSGFDVTLSWTSPPPYEGAPPIFLGEPSSLRQGGDDVENATVVTELGQLTGTTVGYSDTYDEVCPYTGATSPDVVYSFTPATDMAVNMTTCYSTFDTKLYVYENSAGTLAVTTGGDPACSDDTYPPGVDDCTAWTSYIEGVAMTAGNTYYLVVDGYGYSEGDYVLDVEVYNPLAGITIWGVDGDNYSVLGQAGPNDTEWNTVLFAAEPTDINLAITAVYLIPGIFDPVYSDVVGPVTVTVQIEDNPANLTAMDYGDDVHLMWEPPIDASDMELAYDDGVVANAWWYGGAVAVRFRVNGTYAINGLANSVWTGGWPDAYLGETPFTLSVLAVDSDTDLPGDTLYQEAVLVDADPTSETYGWAMTSALEESPVTVTGDVFIMYSDFGYDFDAGGPGPDMDMMGCDAVLDFPGNKYNWNVAVPGEWTLDVDYGVLTCGDWILHMNADFTVGGGASFGNDGVWVDAMGQPSVSDLPPVFAEMEAASTKEMPVELMNPPVSGPIWETSIDRNMVAYNIYRDGAMIDDQDPMYTEYLDQGLDWGTYTYYVTAEYSDGHESIATNEVEVTLSNVAPDAVMLISPADGYEVEVTEDNLDEEVAFIWTAANDADNDPVEYYLGAQAVIGEDYLPDNALWNASFEDYEDVEGSDWQQLPADWEGYPHMNNMDVVVTGEDLGFGAGTFEAYDDSAGLKMWGLYEGENSENNVFQTWFDGMLPPGTQFWVDAMVMSPAGDFIGNGNSSVVLFAKYFTADWGWLGMHASEPFSADNAVGDEWHYMDVWCEVPEGASIVQVGAMYIQPTGDDHGPAILDDFYMHIPLVTTGFFVSNAMLADLAIEAGVNDVTVAWDVWSFDGFEATPSSSGARELNIHVDEAYASLHGIDLPTEFALHNNYPNPFNPVTNILYDIPEVSEVNLEIYNVMGQRVRTLVQGTQEPGRYQIVWNATNDFGQALSSGMYIYRIQAGDFVSVKKLVLMK